MQNFLEKIKKTVERVNPLFIILPLCLLLLLNISKQYLWTDEVFSYHAAQMIVEKGKPLYDSGLNYARAPIYHELLATLFKTFGDSIFLSRAINVLFSFITSLFIYSFFKDENKKMGLLASILFLTTNFTLATVRETRMYTMTAMFMTASIFYLYSVLKEFDLKKTLIENINIKKILSLLISLIFLAAAYYTHASVSALGFGIILFLLLWSIIEKDRKLFALFILSIILILLGMYWQYSSINILQIIEGTSPQWASRDFSKIYYSILLARNLPILFISIPLIIYSFFKKNLLSIFSGSLLLGYLAFISIQPAQQERYLVLLIPIVILTVASSLDTKVLENLFNFKWIKKETQRLLSNLYRLMIILALIFHLGLYIKEHLEIDTYTPTSISIHKKFKFNDLMERLKEYPSDIEILADYHSAFTLHFYGFEVKGILVHEDHPDIQNRDTDIYFEKPFLVYGSKHLKEEIEDTKRDIVIVRDLEDLKLVFLDSETFETVLLNNSPTVYKEK